VATLLLKTEPSEYSYDDLERDRRTAWSGVRNAQALQVMRAARRGDEAFIYHTGDEKRIVGLARVVSDARPDRTSDDDRVVCFDIAPLNRARSPVSLAQIKADKRFASFLLIRNSRLSVMEVPRPLDRLLRQMAGL